MRHASAEDLTRARGGFFEFRAGLRALARRAGRNGHLLFALVSAVWTLAFAEISPSSSPAPSGTPQSTGQLISLADEQLAQGNWSQAQALLEQSLAVTELKDQAKLRFDLGRCLYQLDELDEAAEQFSRALSLQDGDRLTEPSLQFLWQIAEQFRAGAKHHLLGVRKLPRWSTDPERCLDLYNQISETLPYSPLAASALFAKGQYLHALGDYSRSNEALTALVGVFPKEEIAANGFALISSNLWQLMQRSPGDDDLLTLAASNFQKLRAAFPQAFEQIRDAEKTLGQMRSLCAQQLCTIGRYYQRRRQPGAAEVYFEQVLSQFSETPSAGEARAQLDRLTAVRTRR